MPKPLLLLFSFTLLPNSLLPLYCFIRKVSYQKQKDGNYKLVLDVPADKIKMDLGFGKDNTIGGSFNVNDDKKDKSPTTFSLSTKDETVVKEMVQRFEVAVREARR